MSSPRTLTALTAAAALMLSACADDTEPSGTNASETPGGSASPEETSPPSPSASEPAEEESETQEPAEDETEDAADQVLQQQGVSAGHPLAAEAGEEILAEGGNAVDAAIATAFAVSVVEPFASGIGGGGSAILAGHGEDPEFYDYREVVNQSGEIPENDAGIPGFVAGMGELHESQGSLDWEQILEPARELAAEGFEVSEFLAERIAADDGQAALSDLEEFNGSSGALQEGEELVQPDLAQTLESLQQNGWEDFYTGDLADSLQEEAEGMDAESLADYEVQQRDPANGEVGEQQVLAASGSLPGEQLIEMLQEVEAAGIAEMSPDSAEYVETLSEAWLEVEDQVLHQLGGEGISPQGATAQGIVQSQPQEADDSQRGANTTHISVVDENGAAVSMTNTIMYFWGSSDYVDGYFLNNHLSRFEAINSSANQPEPGGRTTTWSNPAMVLDDEDRPVMVIGSPGGHQILNIMGTVMTQLLLQSADLDEALSSLRFRAEASTLNLEEGFDDAVIDELESDGWSTEIWPDELASFGSVQPLVIDYESGTLSSADDHRRDGAHRILE